MEVDKHCPINILLIEDNPGDSRLIREMLAQGKDFSFHLECTERLSTGLDRLDKGGIGLVLLDLSLPDSHGQDTFKRVSLHAPDVPVIMLTGLDDETMALETVENGAQDYLVKGQVDGNILVRSIRYAISRKEVEKELNRYRFQLEDLVKERTAQLMAANAKLQEEVIHRQGIEETLRAERQRLYSLMDGLPAFVHLQSIDCSIHFTNHLFRKHFGEIRKKDCGHLLCQGKDRRGECPTMAVFKTQKPRQWEWVGSDGLTTYEIYDYPFTELDGSPLVLELGIDVTERKHIELNLRSALSEIKELKDRLEAEKDYLQDEIKGKYNYENLVGQSDVLNEVLGKVEKIARTDTHVLLLGESGTGKELVARAIHSLSPRKDRALVKINCATLPPTLIESELFGHEKGAFSGAHARRLGRFEVADGATLFLDEIGELPLELQPKLLRVIQDGEFERLGSSHTIKVDVRIIAATNRHLEEEVRRGRFREDLWFRLNIFPITLPPLRDRSEDIPLLVQFYVDKISKRLGKTIESIPTSVMKALKDYHWPGNIREMENVLERAVINFSGPKLHLMDELKKAPGDVMATPKTMAAVERDHIIRVLEETHGKVSGQGGAAEILGLNRSTLRARMRKLGIRQP